MNRPKMNTQLKRTYSEHPKWTQSLEVSREISWIKKIAMVQENTGLILP